MTLETDTGFSLCLVMFSYIVYIVGNVLHLEGNFKRLRLLDDMIPMLFGYILITYDKDNLLLLRCQ